MAKEAEAVQTVRYTIKKFIELIRGMFDADVCYLYLISTEMDPCEKRIYLRERLDEIKDAYSTHNEPFPEKLKDYDIPLLECPADTKLLDSIDVLKYIDVAEKKAKTWDYNYKKRPKKYIVFKNFDRDQKILKEGLTAYIARTGTTLICNNDEEINEHECVAFLNSNFEIADPCYLMIGFPLIDERGNTIGVLKIENYRRTKRCNYTYEDKPIQDTLKFLPLLARLIESSKIYFSTNSYKELFRSMDLLEKLKTITPSGKENKQIHEATLHLFYVLKRNEYSGYEEILERITNYAADISEILLLDSQMTDSFKLILDKTRKHEELLLYGLDDYRDHFMHQFHVFISGYIIINKLGIEIFRSKIQKSINYILGSNEPEFEISEINVLRIWFFAAFYHDHAYILEKLESELSSFLKNVLGYPFIVNLSWEKLLTKGSNFPEYLTNLTQFFSSPEGTNPEILLRDYLDSIINSHDHGVLSALLLINYNKEATQERIDESLYAALAISVHTKAIYENLSEADKNGISFESFPIAFLLAFCDTAQSFGRLEKKAGALLSAYPVEFLDIDVVEGESVRYKLRYISDHKCEIPTKEILAKWAKNVHNAFRSKDYCFEINYFKREQSKPIYTLSFH